MKLNKILMAFAAVAMVGCSSEDLGDFSANQTPEEAGLIQLDENFALAGVGAEDGVTRTHWELLPSGSLVNKFLPIWATAPAGGNTIDNDADLEAQAVGLCWLGNGAVGTNVYTNYEFYHFGWLTNGATAPVLECNNLTNGAMYNEINVAAGDAAGAEANTAKFSLAVAKTFAIGTLNYNSGIYKTENKAIFGGQYIVYYPYNEEFKNAGTIPAEAVTTFNPAPEALTAPALGLATFRYSSPVTIEGGSKAAGFGLHNLSTLVQLRVAGPAGTNIGKNIDQIVLYSPSQQILKQANLAADQIAAGKKGTDLYTSTEGTKTISAKFAAPVAVAATDGVVTSAYITVLPTTVEDLVVFVHSTDGKWATKNLGNTVFEAGKAKRLDIAVKAADFQAQYIAVDETTLLAALVEADGAAATSVKTINVIGDITLTANRDLSSTTYPNATRIKITGDDIIVPENVTLTLENIMESDLRVLGKSCCSNPAWLGGRLVIEGGTVNNVTMEKTEANATTKAQYDQYNPEVEFVAAAPNFITVAAGKKFDAKAGNVLVNAPVQHKAAIEIAEDVTLTVNEDGLNNGDIQFMGSTVLNDGTIEVKKGGMFDMTDANGNATATDGQRMTNNGKFIHNVDAGVGTAVQSMVQNGEYRCCVDDQIKLADAYLQWTACSVIEMVNAGALSYNLGIGEGVSYKHNGKFIDIEVNAGALTTFNNPVVSGGNGDSKDIQTGKLTVIDGGLDIDYIQGTGKRTLTVNGDMTVKANTTITDSKKITVTENLTVENGATLLYKGAKANVEGLAVTKDITVKGAGTTFNAGEVNALNITSANFYLKSGATALFGNRTEGDSHNLDVTGIIDNPATCTFNIIAANQNGAGSVLAWVTCSTLKVGGAWGAARPRVQ